MSDIVERILRGEGPILSALRGIMRRQEVVEFIPPLTPSEIVDETERLLLKVRRGEITPTMFLIQVRRMLEGEMPTLQEYGKT